MLLSNGACSSSRCVRWNNLRQERMGNQMIEHRTVDTSLMAFNQLFAEATQCASDSMSRWTSGTISLSLDEVRDLPLEDVANELELGYELLTMIVLTLDGPLDGQLILTFDEENGRQLASSLLGRKPTNDGDDGWSQTEWSPLEQSALSETGNILGCAYIKALTDLLDLELVPSPPMFVQDFGASMIEQAVISQSADCERAIVCRTQFSREGKELDWNVFFVPSQALLERLENALESRGGCN